MLIFNKIDSFTFEKKDEDDLTPIKRENISLEQLKKTWMTNLEDECLFISATKKLNINELRDVLYEKVKEKHLKRYPYNKFLY